MTSAKYSDGDGNALPPTLARDCCHLRSGCPKDPGMAAPLNRTRRVGRITTLAVLPNARRTTLGGQTHDVAPAALAPVSEECILS